MQHTHHFPNKISMDNDIFCSGVSREGGGGGAGAQPVYKRSGRR